MRFGSVILTAIGIVLACSLPAITGAYLLAHHTPESWWAGAILVIATFLFLVAVTVLFLRRFLFRQFNTLFHLMDKRDISEEELSLLSGKSDIMSNIRKNLMEWNRDKAMEIGQLRQMEKYRKDFLGDVSHELKTPIFNIQGYILTLLDGGLEDKTINRLYLERSEKSINRMIHIVEDLESIARLESGEFHLDYEFFDMSRLVEEVFEMEEMAARETKIRLEMKKKQVIVYADRKRITEVMDNLVGNSIKYGRKNGLTHVSFTEKDHLWLISVSDNGIGISDNDCKHIFDRFYRCDKGRSREQGGTGLGLAIVKHIVEAHGQTVTVQSVPGEGSAFTFGLSKYPPGNNDI